MVRARTGEDAFAAWGWRIPFLVSAALLCVSLWIRLQLNESPMFQRMVAAGKGSQAPLAEAFGRWSNLKIVLLALFGLAMGQAVVWYAGQFYALFFLERVLRVDGPLANSLVAIALLIGTPFFVLFGWLSDKVGRKPIILLGCLLATLTYFPLFKALTGAANPVLAAASASAPVTVVADPGDCSFQFDPVARRCSAARATWPRPTWPRPGSAMPTPPRRPARSTAQVRIGQATVESFRGEALPKAEFDARKAAWEKGLAAALADAGYPAKADAAKVHRPMVWRSWPCW